MRSHSHRRAIAALLAVVTAVLLSGCSAWPFSQAASLTGAPKAGSCWESSSDAFFDDYTWHRGAPQSCSGSYNEWTYAVLPLTGMPAGAWGDSDGTPHNAVSLAAQVGCSNAFTHVFPHVPQSSTQLMWTWLLPTEAQWKQGAHWVRCDMIRTSGGSYAEPSLQALPSRMADLASDSVRHPADYEYCVGTSSATGDPESTKAHAQQLPCTGGYDWRLALSRSLWPHPGAWPGQKAVDAVAERACRAADHEHRAYTYYDPDKTSWLAGYDSVDCWVKGAA